MHHDAITSALLPARFQALRVNQHTQSGQSRHRYARRAFHDDCATTDLIEHPAGDENPKVRLALGDHSRVRIRPECANHLNFEVEKWVEPVCDPRRTELMSSVSMR